MTVRIIVRRRCAVDKSGLLTIPVDTTSKMTRGGTWPTVINADVPHFDSIGRYHTGAYAQNLMSYSVLADFKTTIVKGETYPTWGFEPEGAASWEISADGLTADLEAAPGPEDGPPRADQRPRLRREDLDFSYKKFSTLNARRGDILNSVNPIAPVISSTYPDANTMVWKLALPVAGAHAEGQPLPHDDQGRRHQPRKRRLRPAARHARHRALPDDGLRA